MFIPTRVYESLKRAFLAASESASLSISLCAGASKSESVESIGESPSAPELAKSSIVGESLVVVRHHISILILLAYAASSKAIIRSVEKEVIQMLT